MGQQEPAQYGSKFRWFTMGYGPGFVGVDYAAPGSRDYTVISDVTFGMNKGSYARTTEILGLPKNRGPE